MSKSTIIKGTLILTITGLITRVIGFFYKIYLSNLIGARNLGVYQLIFPVYGICFTLYGSGIQTAISKLIAEECGKGNKKNAKRILTAGIFLSVSIAGVLSAIIYYFSDFIAVRLLLEADCASSLRILAAVFPFCGVTACINGYYYGLKKASVPAFSQLLEQIVRVTGVMVLVNLLPTQDVKTSCDLAVYGILAGEIASQLYNTISLMFKKNRIPETDALHKENSNDTSVPQLNSNGTKVPQLNSNDTFKAAKTLAATSFPLTLNRLLISILHSFEAVLIPHMMKQYGMTATEALSLYGILNGMSIPFILFPSTLTNSLSVLLLPAISEAKAKNNLSVIASTTSLTLKYSLILGIFSTGFFLTFGEELGTLVYNEPLSGVYLSILAWLCPFLYVATTLNSIINGLGKINLALFTSVSFLGLRIILLCILIPSLGIRGYFISLLVSQLLMTLCDYIIVWKCVPFSLDVTAGILKPCIVLFFCCDFCYRLFEFLQAKTEVNHLLLLLFSGIVLLGGFLFSLIVTRAVSIKELRQMT